LPPWAFNRADDAFDQQGERGVIQRHGAAEAHVMFGQASPDDRQDQGWLALRHGLFGGPCGDGFAQDRVDLDRQMRAMLFQRSDRQDDDGIAACLLAQFVGAQLAPFVVHESLLQSACCYEPQRRLGWKVAIVA
jgi:hypothetical protein